MLEDIYVSEKEEFYILAERQVIKTEKSGNVLEVYDIPESIIVPTSIGANAYGEIVVNQAKLI